MKIGTDFSGIGAPEMALKYLGIDFESVFACEIDKYARKSFEQLHAPKTFYNDITTRNHSEVEQLDLYVAGFPCQSFSTAGKRKGFEETRGTLFFNVADFIKENQPKCFVLENVKGLLSHDKGRTFQTIVDVLSNGGGTQNGQISLDMLDDGLGYHIYWKVLNTKNFGIPQNRERIFIVGFKDFRDFTFPKEMPLELKLKDILEDEVNEKYYLSEKMIESFSNHKERHKEKGTGFQWKPKQPEDVANCLRVNEALCPTDNTVISHSLHTRGSDRPSVKKNKNAGGSGHLSKQDGTSYCLDAANSQAVEIKGAALRTWPRTSNPDKDREQGRSKRLELRKDNLANSITTHEQDSIVWVADYRNDEGLRKRKDGSSPCLSARRRSENDISTMPPIVKQNKIRRLPDLTLKVSKRANETPKEINDFLKIHKKGTIKEIAESLNIPKTQAEHYFRTDNSRAIPSPEVWIKLKELLGFGDKFDVDVMEINESIGAYETRNRLYSDEGISATLQTNDGGYYQTKSHIRRLTPLECWRLQGFKDEDFHSVKDLSDTQLYKQAGNSITVDVLMHLFQKIYG